MPPTTRTIPLFSSVAVCKYRAVFRLPVTEAPGMTVNVVEPLIRPEAASIVVGPKPVAVATPCVPEVLLMVATPIADELHVTVSVTSCMLLLVYVPVAVNCCLAESEIVGSAGVTAIETSVGEVTVRVVDP